MAHQLNEYLSTYIEQTFELEGIPMVRTTLVGYGDPHEKAKARAERGESCAVVTERVTWRGKNGKRTRTEIERIEYPATV